jgi:transcriptional regulator with XRE-family HTH domain
MNQKLSDKELLRQIMYLKEWNQTRLAEEFGVTQPLISQILREKKPMNTLLRNFSELYLEKILTEQGEQKEHTQQEE